MSALSLRSAPLRGSARLGGGDRLVPQPRLAGPIPWVIAIMITLTVIAAAGGLALRNLGQNARSEIAGGLTVQVLEGAPAERERQARRALALLGGREDVATVRRVPDAELSALLEPWLGAEVLSGGESIPMPVLIDVRLKGPATPLRLEQLGSAIGQVAPSARVDAQSGWLRPVLEAVRSLQWLALALIVLLAATSAAAVWLAARSALGSNRETIEIVHLLGATDRQIARIFQRATAVDALLGGILGLLLGLLAVWLLGRQFTGLGSGMVAAGGLQPMDWLVLASIPVIGVLLAMLTARLTVLGALRRTL